MMNKKINCFMFNINLDHLNIKDFMEEQQHGFSDSTPRAGSDRLKQSAKSLLLCITINVN